jgi:hypothetical protein
MNPVVAQLPDIWPVRRAMAGVDASAGERLREAAQSEWTVPAKAPSKD